MNWREVWSIHRWSVSDVHSQILWVNSPSWIIHSSQLLMRKEQKAENVPVPIIYWRDVLLGGLRTLKHGVYPAFLGRGWISRNGENLSQCSGWISLCWVSSPLFIAPLLLGHSGQYFFLFSVYTLRIFLDSHYIPCYSSPGLAVFPYFNLSPSSVPPAPSSSVLFFPEFHLICRHHSCLWFRDLI